MSVEDERPPVELIRTWCFLSLGLGIVFVSWEFAPLVGKLCRNLANPEKNKINTKPLGGFDEDDPLRKLVARESIYSLAFGANLTSKTLDEYDVA